MKGPIHPVKIADDLTISLRLHNIRGTLASRYLNKKSKKYTQPNEYIDLAWNVYSAAPSKFIGWPIKPAQVKQEIEALLNIVAKQNISTMLEIGTFNGGTLFLFSRIVSPNATLISLDLPGGEFGGGYADFKSAYFTNFATHAQHIFLLRENSHSKNALSKVKSILNGKLLDFLFIDGDHTYEGVKQDFERYSPLVRKGGVIAFHDICKHPLDSGCNVQSYWNEIKQKYNNEEIISNANQQWAGIGILYL